MGKDLCVYYYPDSSFALYSDDDSDDSEDWERRKKAYEKRVEFEELYSLRHVDLAYHDSFHGTCKELENIIRELLNEDEPNFIAIGNLSIILGHCPLDYDYITISNY